MTQNQNSNKLITDPFYSKKNIKELEKRIHNLRSGKSVLKEHDLLINPEEAKQIINDPRAEATDLPEITLEEVNSIISEARAETSLRETALANPDLPADFIRDVLIAKDMPTEPFCFDDSPTKNSKSTLEDVFEGHDGQYKCEEINLEPIGKEYQPSDTDELKGDC